MAFDAFLTLFRVVSVPQLRELELELDVGAPRPLRLPVDPFVGLAERATTPRLAWGSSFSTSKVVRQPWEATGKGRSRLKEARIYRFYRYSRSKCPFGCIE